MKTGDKLLDQVLVAMDRLLKAMQFEDSPAGRAARAEAEAKARKQAEEEVARQNAEVEFRLEVIEEMVSSGIARHVAANRTATEQGLLACARQYGVI